MEYLGAALGELVTKATSEYAGKTVEIYDHAPTGQDLADILFKVHGRAPAISAFTDDDLEAKISSDPFSALEAVSIKHCKSSTALGRKESLIHKGARGTRSQSRILSSSPGGSGSSLQGGQANHWSRW